MCNMPNATGSRVLSRVDAFLANHTDFLAHADTTTPANTECPICLEDISEHICVKIVDIPGCVHMIGLECLQVLLDNHPNDKKLCPLCRTDWLGGPGPGLDIGYDSDSDELYDPESDYDNRYRPDIRYDGGYGPNIRSTTYVHHWPVYDDTADLAQHAGARQLPVQQDQRRPSYLGPRMSEYLSMNGPPGHDVGSSGTTRAQYVPHSQRVPGYTYNGGPARHGSRDNQQAGPLQQTGGHHHNTNSTHRVPGSRVEATSRYGQPLADVPWTITGQYGPPLPLTPPFGRRHQHGSTAPLQLLGAPPSVQPTRHQHGSTAPSVRTGTRPLPAQPTRPQRGSTASQLRTGARPPPAQSCRRQHTPSQLAHVRPHAPNHTRIQQTPTAPQARTLSGRSSPTQPADVTMARTAGQIRGQISSSRPVNITTTRTACQVRFTYGQDSSVQLVRVTTTRTGGPNLSVRHEVSATTITMTSGSAQVQARGEVVGSTGVPGIVATPTSGRH